MCCWSSYTWPAYIWSIVSVLAAITVAFSVYFSNWIQLGGEGNYTSLSPYRLCEGQRIQISVDCAEYLSFDNIYSDYWKASTILFGVGACLLILVAITSLFGMVVPRLFSKIVTILMIVAQTIAVLALSAVVFLFPAGFGAMQVKHHCSDSEAYRMGSTCYIGWAYILFIVGTAISIVAVLLSWTPLRRRKKREETDHIPYDS
jgi:hypothetical protein